ncbi:MAG: DUF1107 domain-containing protein [Succinivibrionaceae bacterium]
MRIFKQYSPRLIAKYVKFFFKGRIYIKGRGGYTFEYGKVVMPNKADNIHTVTVSEINNCITHLS